MQIYGNSVRLGIHSGQLYATVDECINLWQRVEEYGYDWISIFDHFRPTDTPDGPCFEGTTLLAAMAALTFRIRCGMLVLNVANRHPAIVASIATTIDHISNGRIELGIGAGAPDLSHDQYGLPFPSVGTRMEMLDETCQIVRSLWNQDITSFTGKHYVLNAATLKPKPLQKHLPLVIGGSGERKTLQIVARHADIWNTISYDLDQYQRKLNILTIFCDANGRDVNDIRKSLMFRISLFKNEDEREVHFEKMFKNIPTDSPLRKGFFLIGTPEECIEKLSPFIAIGVKDILIGVRSPIDWQTIELFANHVAPALRKLCY